MVFDPGVTVNFNPDVSFVRYQAGVMALPGGGGPPVDDTWETGASEAITVTWYSPGGRPSSRPVNTE
jgi:hypothetical protein